MEIVINSHIGLLPKEGEGFMLSDIVSATAKEESKQITIKINSFGGNLNEASAICDYIQSLKDKGVHVTTFIDGVCMSAAVKIFLKGDTRNWGNCEAFLIHNPWLSTEGDSYRMQEVSNQMRELDNREAEYMAEILKVDKAAILALMKMETVLTKAQAKALNFITDDLEEPKYKAVAFINSNTMEDQKMSELESNLWKRLEALLFKKDEVKMIVLQDFEGREIEFPERETGLPEVNDAVRVAGQPITETIPMPDGNTYTVVNGVLESIEETEPDADPLAEEIEMLKKENDSLKAQLSNKAEREAQMLDIRKKIEREFEDFKKQVQSNYTPDVSPRGKGESQKEELFTLKNN